jgi:hypothetical protein
MIAISSGALQWIEAGDIYRYRRLRLAARYRAPSTSERRAPLNLELRTVEP